MVKVYTDKYGARYIKLANGQCRFVSKQTGGQCKCPNCNCKKCKCRKQKGGNGKMIRMNQLSIADINNMLNYTESHPEGAVSEYMNELLDPQFTESFDEAYPEDGVTEQWFRDHSDEGSFNAWRTAFLDMHSMDGNGSTHIDEMDEEEFEDDINFIRLVNVARGHPFEGFVE